MRRRDITSEAEILEIIGKARWCHIAMVDGEGKPYLLPMNFGFRDGIIYMHGAQHGKKIDILRQNPSVCVNFSIDHLLRFQSEEVACSYSMKYRSVLAWGKAEFIEDDAEKVPALDIIMAQYSGRAFRYNPPSLNEVACWKIRVERFEGRIFGY
jgi:nitroimidazol reductase NimA-like FMN-containing flavoprotein (pyridoxamine 5'-phosphate oxidase superfamily)